MKSLRNASVSQDDLSNASTHMSTDDSQSRATFDDEQEFELNDELCEDDADSVPLYEEISSYLDNEMDDEEKKAFETKLAADPNLKAQVDDARATWNVLGSLDNSEPECDLIEPTVNLLNSEAKTELQELEAKEKRNRFALRLGEVAAALIMFLCGYAIFSLFFPDVEQRREKDFRVVARLPLLEAAGSYQFLQELVKSGLFEPKQHEPVPPQNERENVKTYRELSKDRSFYRLQQRFEGLDKKTRQEIRNLYAQIEADDNAAKEWSILASYTFWLATALTDSERIRLTSLGAVDRIAKIQEKIDAYKHMQKFFAQMKSMDNEKFGKNSNTIKSDDQQAEESKHNEPINVNYDANIARSPNVVAFRLTLPEQLRDESLSNVYKKYLDYNRVRSSKMPPARTGGEQFERVFAFLTDVKQEELVELLSPKAQDYLREKTEEERSSILGMLVSLSLLENNGENEPQRKQEFGPRGPQNRSRKGSKEQFDALRPPQKDSPEIFGVNDHVPTPFGFKFNNQNIITIGELGYTLHFAPDEFKDYISSTPPRSAWNALLGLHLSIKSKERDFFQAQPPQEQQPWQPKDDLKFQESAPMKKKGIKGLKKITPIGESGKNESVTQPEKVRDK